MKKKISNICRNAEDIRREEEDAKAAASKNDFMPSYNELAAAGRLLGGSNSNYCSDVDDQISTCSCTCMGGSSCANHRLLIEQGYLAADIDDDDISVGRASV